MSAIFILIPIRISPDLQQILRVLDILATMAVFVPILGQNMPILPD
jgi:hypothetical protein